MVALIYALLALLPTAVFAQDKPEGWCGTVPPKHVPAADVEYKAGLDAYGHAVVPADLPRSGPKLVDMEQGVLLDMRLPVDPYVNKDNYNADLSDTRVRPGMMKVTKDGVYSASGEKLEPPVAGPCIFPAPEQEVEAIKHKEKPRSSPLLHDELVNPTLSGHNSAPIK